MKMSNASEATSDLDILRGLLKPVNEVIDRTEGDLMDALSEAAVAMVMAGSVVVTEKVQEYRKRIHAIEAIRKDFFGLIRDIRSAVHAAENACRAQQGQAVATGSIFDIPVRSAQATAPGKAPARASAFSPALPAVGKPAAAAVAPVVTLAQPAPLPARPSGPAILTGRKFHVLDRKSGLVVFKTRDGEMPRVMAGSRYAVADGKSLTGAFLERRRSIEAAGLVSEVGGMSIITRDIEFESVYVALVTMIGANYSASKLSEIGLFALRDLMEDRGQNFDLSSKPVQPALSFVLKGSPCAKATHSRA